MSDQRREELKAELRALGLDVERVEAGWLPIMGGMHVDVIEVRMHSEHLSRTCMVAVREGASALSAAYDVRQASLCFCGGGWLPMIQEEW